MQSLKIAIKMVAHIYSKLMHNPLLGMLVSGLPMMPFMDYVNEFTRATGGVICVCIGMVSLLIKVEDWKERRNRNNP
jgi:hypothetical protein